MQTNRRSRKGNSVKGATHIAGFARTVENKIN
jgi:hypothetical protein